MAENHPTILVTGASGGLGADICRWLGKTGACVGLAARNADSLARTAADVETLGGQALALPADITSPEDCAAIVEKTVDRFGRLDALVNNAGIVGPIATLGAADPKALRYGFGVNLLGPFFLVHHAISHLEKTAGRVINVSSGAATHPIRGAAHYCAAKAGLNQFTRVLAEESPKIVSVAVRPGVVDTPMQAEIRKEGPHGMPPGEADYYIQLKTRGDLLPAYIPARTIAWLALHAPKSLSGLFINHDDANVAESAQDAFGVHYSD